MAAIKQAVIAREHDGGIEATIYHLDIRAFGKHFDRYYERARDEYGVRFVRARVAKIDRLPDGTLDVVSVTDDDRLVHEAYDLVVLSVGLQPSRGTREMIAAFGLHQTPDGFIATDTFDPSRTSRAGVFACGAATGPKDIPETVIEASAAAAQAGALLSGARHTLTRAKEYPPERDIVGDAPRVGVFVCHCGANIAGTVDVERLRLYASALPYVVYSGRNLFTCSQGTLEGVRDIISTHRLNRVVVASCSPRTHEPLFQETIREAGLNPHLFELANIRDQCAWVHQREPAGATIKAEDLVRMAVRRVVHHAPLHGQALPVVHAALVLGGGVTGMVVALGLAEQGYPVHLVEREMVLGGQARQVAHTLAGRDVADYVDSLACRVVSDPCITVHLGSQLAMHGGFVGRFRSTIRSENPLLEDTVVDHGITVIATGGRERDTTSYSRGQDPRVITQRELEHELAVGAFRLPSDRAATVVMIQCVDSRTPEHPYCSRICCTQAVKNAIALKRRDPLTRVIVLYRDMRTYGWREHHHRQARAMGVLFLRYDAEPDGKGRGGPPNVAATENGLRVEVLDPILAAPMVIEADLLVLSVGIAPDVGSTEVAHVLKVPVDEDGFFLEAHMKLRPVDLATEGIFLAGLAHGPKSLEESIIQAQAAVARACTVLSRDSMMSAGTVAHVDPLCCVACGDCALVCPYSAIEIASREVGRRQFKDCAQVNAALCKGCGACASACRSGCATLEGYDDRQIMAQIQALAAAR